MRVLIIDDDPDALVLAARRLERENLEIRTAADGKSGLADAKENRPDLILLDLQMPDMSGFEILNELKSNEELSFIPVLFLTAEQDTHKKIKALDMGAVDYVTKPFNSYELRARVRAALRTKKLQDDLLRFASVDPLTGLANRRVMKNRIDEEFSRLNRHGGKLAFVFIDIDYFKNVNDTYGHPAGDEVLKAVGYTLKSECRVIDIPARYGGEEFAIILPHEEVQGAVVMAERCRKTIEGLSIRVDRQVVNITASFGVADSKNASNTDELIRQADEMLYHAKASGRNNVQAFGAAWEVGR